MASEPADATLRMLQRHSSGSGKAWRYVGRTAARSRGLRSVEDLYEISTHTLGVAVTAHERYETLEARVEKLAER